MSWTPAIAAILLVLLLSLVRRSPPPEYGPRQRTVLLICHKCGCAEKVVEITDEMFTTDEQKLTCSACRSQV